MGHKNTSSVVFSHNDFLLWPWHNIDVTSLIVCTIHSKWNTKICILNSKGKVSEPNSWTSLKLRRLLFNIAHFTYFPLVEFIWNRMLIMTKDNKNMWNFSTFSSPNQLWRSINKICWFQWISSSLMNSCFQIYFECWLESTIDISSDSLGYSRYKIKH